MDPTTIRRVAMLREGSNVRRCHTVPHHGEYTVGKHSFDALNLILVLHPNPSVELIKAVAWHDMAERFVGDVPSTAFRNNQEYKREYEKAEISIFDKYQLNGYLSDDDYVWLVAVDKLELYLWAHDQVAMGNKNVEHFITNLQDWFKNNILPPRIRHFLDVWGWERIRD